MLARSSARTRKDQIAAAVDTFRVLNWTTLPFQEDAARRYAEAAYDQAQDLGQR